MAGLPIRFLALHLIGILAAQPAAAAVIQLYQDRQVQQAHQRLVGNVRAQARRAGVIRHVPQLFVYHADFSPAYHLEGHRPGFTTELELLVDRFRQARSVVALDTLLERAAAADGTRLESSELAPTDLVIVQFVRTGCDECGLIEGDLAGWFARRDDLEVRWIRISLDRPPAPE